MDFFDNCNISDLAPYTVPLDRQKAEQLSDAIVHKPFYPDRDSPSIYLQVPFSTHVDIRLYNILGQNVGTLYNGTIMEGATEINIKERLHRPLTTGKYIYRIQVQNQKMSKSIMVA